MLMAGGLFDDCMARDRDVVARRGFARKNRSARQSREEDAVLDRVLVVSAVTFVLLRHAELVVSSPR